jgi:dihydrofolate reductase
MVSSLDFFIAKKDQSVLWLQSADHYEKGVAGEDPEEFIKTIGCYVMGSRTYEHALLLGWPYGDTPTIVLTHRHLPTDKTSVDSLGFDSFRKRRAKPREKMGAMLTREFLRLKLADDLRIAIMPIMLGDGTLFVDHVGQEQPLHLKDVTAYKDGMVELWYEIKRTG